MMSNGAASASAAGASRVWGGCGWAWGRTAGEAGGFCGGVGVDGRGGWWRGAAGAAGAVWCRWSDGGWGMCARLGAAWGVAGGGMADRVGGGRWAPSGVVAANGWATANIHQRRGGQEQNRIHKHRSRNKHTPTSRARSSPPHIHVRRRIPAQSLPHTFASSSRQHSARKPGILVLGCSLQGPGSPRSPTSTRPGWECRCVIHLSRYRA